MPWYYYVAKPIVRMWFHFFTRWHIKGRENVPRQGPLLVIANHVNLVDVPLLAVSFDRPVIFMAKKELFQSRLIGYFLGGIGGFPVHRGQLDRKALRQANQILADGQVLAIFPEGKRSHDGRLRYAFPGSALIALRSGAPILPVGITGTEKVKGSYWLLRRPKVTINIGPPFHLPPVNGKLSKNELGELTNFIMGHIIKLLPTEYHGHYAEQGKSDAIKD